MKKLLLAGVTIAAFSCAPVLAADMPVKAPSAPAFSWTGGYIGIQAGEAWYRGDVDFTAGGALTPGPSVKDSAGEFGATIGYNWQNGPWVIGLEADWSWTNINAINASAANCIPGDCRIKSDWFATARGRLGYTITPNTMLYATGGAAFVRVKDISDPGPFVTTATKTTWTAGGGFESMLAQHWSVKAEYLYINVADGPDTFTGVLTVERPRNQNLQVLRAGLNYKF
jgi:outer membrane immunogenic protein